MSSLVGKDTELDAIGRPFEPYLTAGCLVCMLVSALWRDLGCCSRTVVVLKATVKTRFRHLVSR